MSVLPIEAFQAGYVALGLESAERCYVGERPPGAQEPCTVLTPYGGRPHEDLPLDWHFIRVAVYARGMREALARAQEAYEALHRRVEWRLPEWTAARVSALRPPYLLKAADGQGGRVYAIAFRVRALMRGR